MQLPPFDDAGCLPAGDYSMTFSQLRGSTLVLGPGDPSECPTWDAAWRHQLVEDEWDNDLEFPAAFRRSRRDGQPRGIIKIIPETSSDP